MTRRGGREVPDQVREAVAAGEGRKAQGTTVLDLRRVSSFTDFFVIFTGASTRQVQAIARAVEDQLKERGVRPAHIEGMSEGEWVLLDYIDFVVHVFLPEKRDYYGLEKLWHDATEVRVTV